MLSGSPDQQVVIELVAKVDKLEKGMAQAQKSTGTSLKKMAKSFAIVTAAIAAVGVALTKLMKAFVDYAVKIDKAAKVTGMAAENLQKWGYVAEQEHGNFDAVIKAFTMLSQRMVDAEQGLETYAREFRSMGIDLRDAQGKLRSVNDVFLDMGDYVKNATNQTEAMGHMGKLLGARYVKDLMPMLKLTREEIERLGLEAEDLGYVLEGKTVRAAKAFSDKLTKLKTGLKGIVFELAKSLMPIIENIADAIISILPDIKNLIENLMPMLEAAVWSVGAIIKGVLWTVNKIADGIRWLLGVRAAEEGIRRPAKETELERAQRELKELQAKKAELEAITKDAARLAEYGAKFKAAPIPGTVEEHLRAEIVLTNKEIQRRLDLLAEIGQVTLPPPEAPPIVGIGKRKERKFIKIAGRWVKRGGWGEAIRGVDALDVAIASLEDSFEELEGVVVDAGNVIERRMQGWADMTRRIFADPIIQAFNQTFDHLKFKFKETETVFSGFIKSLWNQLMDFAAGVLASSLIQLAVKLVAMLVNPTGGLATMGIGDILMTALGFRPGGFDVAWNDAMVRRQGRDIVDNLVRGIQSAMHPQLAVGGGNIAVIRFDDPVSALARVTVEAPESSRRQFGRATRKAQAVDGRTDI